MQHSNPRHKIAGDLLQQLPTTLLVTWVTSHYLSRNHPTSNLSLIDITIDLIVSLLQKFASDRHVRFCGFLPCRFCTRLLKDSNPNHEIQSLLYYVTCLVFRVRNHGSHQCSTLIPNSTVRPFVVIANEETASLALLRRGITLQFPITTTTSITHQTQTTSSTLLEFPPGLRHHTITPTHTTPTLETPPGLQGLSTSTHFDSSTWHNSSSNLERPPGLQRTVTRPPNTNIDPSSDRKESAHHLDRSSRLR